MQKIISVCGVKNSGKTTLVGRVTKDLSGRGYKVAVIKHDGHDFECDIPGTDTYSFTQSGAYGVACFSNNRTFIHKVGTSEETDTLIDAFPEADVIFVEGLKDSKLPKIEVIRGAASGSPVSNPEGRFLIATDLPAEKFDEAVVDINDVEFIAECVIKL